MAEQQEPADDEREGEFALRYTLPLPGPFRLVSGVMAFVIPYQTVS